MTCGHPCLSLLPSGGTVDRLRCSSLLSSKAGWMPSQHSTSVNFQQSMAPERKPIWYPWNILLHTFITPCSKYSIWASILRSIFVQWCLIGQFHSWSALEICKTFFFRCYFLFFLLSMSFVFHFCVCGKIHVIQNLLPYTRLSAQFSSTEYSQRLTTVTPTIPRAFIFSNWGSGSTRL